MDDCARIEETAALTRADRWLRGAGLRPTRQRRLLAALLVGDGENRHVTAESLYEAARRSGETVSLATVYNTLRSFTEADLLSEISVAGARSYFDTRVESHPHLHFFREDDGEILDAPSAPFDVDAIPEPPEGYEVARVDVVIRLRPKRG